MTLKLTIEAAQVRSAPFSAVSRVLTSSAALDEACMADVSTTRAAALPSARDLITLMKPSITTMSVLVAGGSMLLAKQAIDPARALLALVGVALSVMGAGALNMFIERDVDSLMTRTRNRPLPAGRMEPGWALGLGAVLSMASIPVLLYASNPTAAAITAFSLFAYVLVYTPMKRRSPWSLVVGAVPGAAPALMGYTAITGTIDAVGLTLFGIVFLWQIPHFVAISIYRESEYVAAGHKVVSALHGLDAAKVVVAGSAVPLVAVSFFLWPLGVAGAIYASVAALLGVWFVVLCARGFVAEDAPTWARRVFLGSLVYQTVLFAALALDVGVSRMVGGG
jgi:protoheme IX farnesyltransferase